MRFCHFALPLVALATACSDSNPLAPDQGSTSDSEIVAVVALRAADFSSGAHATINVENNGIQTNLDPDGSDLSIRGDSEGFFRMGRLFAGSDANAVSRYTLEAPGLPISTYSTQDATFPDEGSNPHDILRVNDEKAYVLRYGSPRLWVVNPNAEAEIGFYQGEVDLGAFDSDGVPDMTTGVIAAGRAWVVLQRLTFFSAEQESMIVAIDLATDSIVDLDPSTPAIDGLELPIRNASEIQVSNDGSGLFVLGIGGADFDAEFNATPRFDGGLIRIDLADLRIQTILDDGTAENAPYGQFANFTQDHQDNLWLVAGNIDFGAADRLFRIDATTGTASSEGLPENTQNIEISTLAASPAGDVWLGLAGNAPGLLRFDPRSGSTQSLPLDLVPINIDFVLTDPSS